MMSHMFKVLLNEEQRVKGGRRGGDRGVQERGRRRMRPAMEGCSIVAFRHVWRPKRRGDFRARAEE